MSKSINLNVNDELKKNEGDKEEEILDYEKLNNENDYDLDQLNINNEYNLIKVNLNKENNQDLYPMDYLISKDEIDHMEINIINNNENKNGIGSKFMFFSNLANKIRNGIKNKKLLLEQKLSELLNYNNGYFEEKEKELEEENDSEEGEDEYEDINEIEEIPYFKEYQADINQSKYKNKDRNKYIINRDYINESFYSLSSSLYEDSVYENEIKKNSFIKPKLNGKDLYYIEKMQKWGLRVIFKIILSNKIRIVQNSFYKIKMLSISSPKKRDKVFYRIYHKYEKKAQNELVKQHFLRYKIKVIELKSQEIEKNRKNDINISKSKNDNDLSIPPPPILLNSNSSLIPLPPGVPPPPGFQLPPGVPMPPSFLMRTIPDPTKNIPKLPKGHFSRKFQWEKIEYSNYEKSFWKEFEEKQEKTKIPLKIDYDSLQKMFTYEKIIKKESANFDKKEKITLLDSRRLMNMSISLSKIKISKDKLEKLIKAYDIDNILDIETLNLLLYFFPTEEEKKALINYNDDIRKLSIPEQLCTMLVSIEKCQKIIKILIFKKQLSGKVSNILIQIKILQEAITSINNSEQFKSILFILRQMGNYLNMGTSIGKAFGFSVNSLSKLDSIKGINKEKTSLLEYLILMIKKDNPELLNFYKDFKNLEHSKNCNKEEIDKNIMEINSIIKEIIKEKDTTNKDYLVFIDNVVKYTKAKMDCLELSLKFLNDEIEKTIEIFGENKSKFNVNAFIRNVDNFVEKFKLISMEITQREIRLQKKKTFEEKRKREMKIVNTDYQKINGNNIININKANIAKCINKKKYLKKDLILNIKREINALEKPHDIFNYSERGDPELIRKELYEMTKDNDFELKKYIVGKRQKQKLIKRKIKIEYKEDNKKKWNDIYTTLK